MGTGIVEKDGLAVGETEQESHTGDIGDEPIGVRKLSTCAGYSDGSDPTPMDLARRGHLICADGQVGIDACVVRGDCLGGITHLVAYI
jgi:hypothetical protein